VTAPDRRCFEVGVLSDQAAATRTGGSLLPWERTNRRMARSPQNRFAHCPLQSGSDESGILLIAEAKRHDIQTGLLDLSAAAVVRPRGLSAMIRRFTSEAVEKRTDTTAVGASVSGPHLSKDCRQCL